METTTKQFFDQTFVKTLSLRKFEDMNGLVNSLRRLNTVWCWGAREWTNMNKDTALRFRVSGAKFKGLVFAVVNGSDLFDIYFTKGSALEIKHIENDVYIDELVSRIDSVVER